ncbi:DEKNAAC102258 [Brettanomyces naardenensis]|uniref:DEKNAAC102258 n=1 Tax=Brettanomyces naardenensis TaxID=13370 RepID=A0A448YKQ7_BRENA|nr:DEKNAAC102258 [Brettanomyces naardenensis]
MNTREATLITESSGLSKAAESLVRKTVADGGSNTNIKHYKRCTVREKCFKCDLLSNSEDAIEVDGGPITSAQRRGKRRRRSSSSILYSELLSNSNVGSERIPFTMKLGVSSSTKSYKQLVLPFFGNFIRDSEFGSYTASPSSDLKGLRLSSDAFNSSPYFSEIDLNTHYIDQELGRPLNKYKRKFPGYNVPKQGKLQLIIFNNEKTVSTLILLPYDLSDLSSNTKKIVKFKVYKSITYSLDGMNRAGETIGLQKLINEVEVKFMNYKGKRYYLFDRIKIMFSSRASYSEDYKLPLNLYGTKNWKRLGDLQFNPKIPLLPSDIRNHVERVESDQFKIDLDYYVMKCPFCDATDARGKRIARG